MAKFNLTEETLTMVVGKVLDEKLAPMQSKLNSLEKKVNALSVKDNGVKENKATTTRRSSKSAKTEETTKKGKLQTLAEEFGMSLDRYIKGKVTTYVLTQTGYIRDRYYLEKAMDNKGEVIKGSKFKQYTFKTDEKGIEKVLKAMQKSRNDYRKTLA